ncbi:hypothetical protein [Streptomyces sp. NPDC001056]
MSTDETENGDRIAVTAYRCDVTRGASERRVRWARKWSSGRGSGMRQRCLPSIAPHAVEAGSLTADLPARAAFGRMTSGRTSGAAE